MSIITSYGAFRLAKNNFLRGATPLMLAVQLNDLDGIDYLLQNGADPNMLDNEKILWLIEDRGMTALHYAAIMNNSEAYRKLLEAGASENIRAQRGETARDIARNIAAGKIYRDPSYYSGYVFNEKFEIVEKR